MINSLPVAILAGGLATRLRPVTETIPKALVEVNGEPFIAHQLRLLKSKGIQRVVLCIGYLGEMIQAYLKDGSQFGLQVEYVFDGERLLGTGGAIKRALPFLDEAFFVLYGDSYLPCDYQKVQIAFQNDAKLGLMTVFQNENNWDSSNVEFVNGQILAYDKQNRTPAMRYIDYGLGIFQRSAFSIVPADEPYDLAQLYQTLLNKEQLAAYEIHERFYEAGSFKGIAEMSEYLVGAQHAAPVQN